MQRIGTLGKKPHKERLDALELLRLEAGKFIYAYPARLRRIVRITRKHITLNDYYFPSGNARTVSLDDIEWIQIKDATIMNGKWRIHGTGNFKTWFPKDVHRPGSSKIFFAKLKSQWVKIGFTVEHEKEVERIFGELNLVRSS